MVGMSTNSDPASAGREAPIADRVPWTTPVKAMAAAAGVSRDTLLQTLENPNAPFHTPHTVQGGDQPTEILGP